MTPLAWILIAVIALGAGVVIGIIMERHSKLWCILGGHVWLWLGSYNRWCVRCRTTTQAPAMTLVVDRHLNPPPRGPS